MAIDLSNGKAKKNGAGDKVEVEVKVIDGKLALMLPIDALGKCKGTLSSTGKSMVLATLSDRVLLPDGAIVRLGLNVTKKVG